MAFRIRDLGREWRAGDAERLARFFNKTFDGWPGGGSDPQTPEEAARKVREHPQLGVFVSEEAGEFRSYCSLHARPNEKNGAYVGLLTADPEFHGRGYGKAVLLKAIERVYERGIARVDLHTWPGNMKAVPLYKKSGYMWSPESGQWGVYMQNFTPGARRNPVAREYFRKHDWYATLKRDLSLVPDEHKRGKVRVYEYLWEEGGDRLRMVYDRKSWGLLEVETNDFLIGCSLPDEKLVAGMPQRIRWRVENRRREPVEIALIANADEGVALDHRELLKVESTAESEAEFTIDPEIRGREKDPRSPIIRTDVMIDGRPVRLEAGFETVQAVSFSLDGDGQGLRASRIEPVVIRCRSELGRPARVKLHIAASPGVELSAATASVQLPAKGAAEVPVQVTAAGTGSVTLNVRSEVSSAKRTIRPKQAELHASVLAAGEVIGRVERDRVVLESAALRVSVWRRGGWISITDKLRNRHDVASAGRPQIGPPYFRDEFFEERCEARIEHEHGKATAVLTTTSMYRPGVALEERIRVSNLPVVSIEAAVINNSDKPLAASVNQGVWFQTGGKVSALVGGEVVEGPDAGAGRHMGEHNLPDDGKEWTEGWRAAEGADGATAGTLWDTAERVEWGEVTRKLPAAAPGQSVSAGPMYVFVGEGGPFAVRRWWQMLFGARVDREQRPAEKRQPFEFGLSPRPLVIHGSESAATLVVDSVGKLELAGRLSIELPKGLSVSPVRLDFNGANQAHKVRRRAVVTRGARTPEGGYFAESTARLDRAIYHERQPIIVLGDPAKRVSVRSVEKGTQFRIANGVLALTVAPGFMGSAISLVREGEGLLRSAYPQARPLAWMNPWTGGIQPGFGGMAMDEVFKQTFRAREVTRRGSQGIEWRGVRVSCSPKEGQRREDALAVDYLLAPGSSIFAVCIRVTHRAAVSGWVDASFQLYPVIGGSYLDAVVSASADERASRIRCAYDGRIERSRWAIAENPKAGEAMVLASAGKDGFVGGIVWGRDGYCLSAWRGATHEARETSESVFLAAPIEAARARDLSEALVELKGLP